MSIAIAIDVVCDECGHTVTSDNDPSYGIERQPTIRAMLDEAKKQGWHRVKLGNHMIDVCDDCYWLRYHEVPTGTVQV